MIKKWEYHSKDKKEMKEIELSTPAPVYPIYPGIATAIQEADFGAEGLVIKGNKITVLEVNINSGEVFIDIGKNAFRGNREASLTEKEFLSYFKMDR